MVSEIIGKLSNDLILKALIGGTEEDSHIYPLNSFINDDCIVYKHIPVSDDGIKSIDRLEITINTTSYSNSLEIENRIKDLILTVGDKPFSNSILEIELNGGGALYDGKRDKVQRILFFNILYRR